MIKLLIAFGLLFFGYYTLFTLNTDLPYEEVVIKVRTGQVSILIGSFLLVYYLYKRL